MIRWWRRRRSAVERVPLPRALPWAVLALGLGALAACAIAPGVLGVDRLVVGTPLSALVSGRVGDTVGTVLLVSGVLALRHAALARLARRPGPVEVTLAGRAASDPPAPDPPASGDGAAGGDGNRPQPAVDVDEVLADFRRALTEMSLTTPQAVPNSPQDDGFLDDVTTIADKQGNWLATAAGLLKALLQVRYAYRVSVQPRTRAGPQGYGLTLHMLARPGNRGTIDTVWSDDWTDVAERAAHRVGAFILTRSRLSRRAWSGWHGLEMPAELFHRSQLGRRCLAENRFEEAIGHFHDALKLDPQNPYLRIELAQAQEQIGLYLDALAGYADVIAIESWFDRRLWRRLRRLLDDDPTDQPPARIAARPVHGRNALLIARYRLVARLVSASQLSHTLVRSFGEERHPVRSDNLTRMRERIVLRRRVSVWLEPYYTLYTEHLRMRTPLRFTEFAEMEQPLRHFLHFVGTAETLHLIDDYRWSRGRRRPGMPATQTALRVMRIWAPLHLQHSEQQVDYDFWVRSGRSPARRAPWPPDGADLDSRLARVLRRVPAALRGWPEHYNAACTMAVALTAPPATDRRVVEQLALRAVRHLERAVSATDSGTVGSYAQWLSTGDEDLQFLRSTRAFVDFLERYLPNPAHRVPRPKKLLSLVMTQHILALVQRYAAARAEVLAGSAGAAELRHEAQARATVRTALAEDQDWASRLRLIEEGRALCRRHGFPPFVSRLPSFQDDPAAAGYTRAWVAARRPARDEPDFVVSYFDGVLEYRRDRRSALAAAIRPVGGGGVDPAEAREHWVSLDRAVAAAYLPGDRTVAPPVPFH